MTAPAGGGIGLFALGNVLHADDGVGPVALEFLLSHWELPESLTVADLGTPGVGLATHLLGLRHVILLDALRGSPSGSLARWEFGGEAHVGRKGLRHCHDAGILQAAAWAALADPPTRVVMVGVRVERINVGVGLSRLVALAVPALAGLAVDELVAAGAPVRSRAVPLPPGAWWARGTPLAEVVTPGA